MSRRDRTRMLSEIVRVRQVQERAAEMEVARVNTELHSLGVEREGVLQRLTDTQESWTAAVAGQAFDPAITAAWAGAVLQTQDDEREVASRIDRMEEVKLGRSQAWRMALARADVARDLERVSGRDDRRAREETSLAELADRIALKGQPQ